MIFKNINPKDRAKRSSSEFHRINSMLAVLILLIISAHTQTAPTYSATTNSEKVQMRTDTKDAVLNLKSSSDPAQTFSISYSSPMAPSLTAPNTIPKLVVITSISTFDCLASTQFSFNMSVTSPTVTSFGMQFQIFGNTYLNKLKFNYLAVAWDPAYTNIAVTPNVGVADILYSDCFLTSDLAVVTTNRSQVFNKQILAGSVTDNSTQKIQSFITGLKFFNNKDVSKKVMVGTTIQNGNNTIRQNITVTGNTVLEWICLGTIIIDTTFSDFYQQIHPTSVGFFVLDRVSASIDMTTFPTNYLTKFDKVDNKFFGLIEIQLFLGKPYQIVKFLSENIGTVELGYQSLAAGGKMGYFFMAKRECPAATPLYSLKTGQCFATTCPIGTAQDGTLQICALCHYSCSSCTGLLSTQCDACDPLMLRDPVAAGQCNCMAGYIDNGVSLCAKCIDFLPLCQECTNLTSTITPLPAKPVLQCTKCTQTFFDFVSLAPAPGNNGCACFANQFFVNASSVCAPFPGCILATANPAFATCTQCNTTANFQATPSSICNCLPGFDINGSVCVDHCGDGINPYPNSTTYCDDQNNGLYGCSTLCAVQSGWGCFNPPNNPKSFCSPVKDFTLKYLYAERIVSQNAGNFYFEVSPVDTQLSDPTFTFYVETTIPHTTAIGTYDSATSILKIKIIYLQTIQDSTHDIKITLDPYKMSVIRQNFTIKTTGVNYDLTIEDNPKINTYIWYMTAAVCGVVVIASLVFVFINYKIAGVELLLSSQLVYMALLAGMNNNLSLYPLTGLRYLTGYNTLQLFQINKHNSGTPFLLSSYTFAEFLLNINIMVALVVLVIFILIPLKINVWFRTFQRNRFTSPEMQQKLMTEEPTISLSEMSSKIKTAQYIADTYVDRIYFGFSLVVFLPIVLYFSIQLGFIGKVGRYELSSFANIMLSILLLMLDFCFFILIFQDTDKKLKTFNFGSKKFKSYPNRLMMFYFATCCLFTIVLLSDFTFYVLVAMTILTGIYIVVQNPYEKISLEYVDSISKPIIALACQIAIKATTFFDKEVIFIPIGVDALLLISTIVSIVRVVRVKTSRAEAAKKMLEDADGDDEENDLEKNAKNTNDSEYDSKNHAKKISNKFNKLGQEGSSGIKESNQNNENDDSAGELNKQDSPNHNDNNEEELAEEEEDELTRIKRSLRQDLKKRRGIVQKVASDDVPSTKLKKSKRKTRDYAEDKKNQ